MTDAFVNPFQMRDELAQNGLNVTTQQIKVKIDNLTQAYRYADAQ